MPPNESHNTPLWPLLLYAALVVILLAAILALSYVLGQRHHDRATGKPYEGGIEQTGAARLRFSAKFYLVAMLFVIFDVEAVFIMLWALGLYSLGWRGYLGALIFIGQLAVVLVYEWGIGALNIGASTKKIMRVYKRIKSNSYEMVDKHTR
jgi:NADH-quinone oxidoreductase subunit A